MILKEAKLKDLSMLKTNYQVKPWKM